MSSARPRRGGLIVEDLREQGRSTRSIYRTGDGGKHHDGEGELMRRVRGIDERIRRRQPIYHQHDPGNGAPFERNGGLSHLPATWPNRRSRRWLLDRLLRTAARSTAYRQTDFLIRWSGSAH
jgi:hypothetical protein